MLTTTQLQALKADIAADPVFGSIPHTPDNAFAVAVAYNAVASPAFYVWKSSVPTSEIMGNGFDWTRVDNLTVGKARIWEWMVDVGSINPSQANVRTGVLAVFTTAGDLAMRLAIFGHCQRLASRVEKLFATGAGTSVTEQGTGPATTVYEGSVSYQDVVYAWES